MIQVLESEKGLIVEILDEKSTLKSNLYWSAYDFELYSNFTFFLEDPVNGDQIRQKEDRNIFGLNSEYQRSFSTDKLEILRLFSTSIAKCVMRYISYNLNI